MVEVWVWDHFRRSVVDPKSSVFVFSHGEAQVPFYFLHLIIKEV